MHCTVNRESPLFELLLMGSVEIIYHSFVRLQSVRVVDSPVVMDGYVLFEFQIDRVLSVEYGEHHKPVPHRWKRQDAVPQEEQPDRKLVSLRTEVISDQYPRLQPSNRGME